MHRRGGGVRRAFPTFCRKYLREAAKNNYALSCIAGKPAVAWLKNSLENAPKCLEDSNLISIFVIRKKKHELSRTCSIGKLISLL